MLPWRGGLQDWVCDGDEPFGDRDDDQLVLGIVAHASTWRVARRLGWSANSPYLALSTALRAL